MTWVAEHGTISAMLTWVLHAVQLLGYVLVGVGLASIAYIAHLKTTITNR